MNEAQRTAFEISAGASPQMSALLFVGLFLAILFLWAGWTLLVVYKGWASRNVESGQAGGAVVRVLLLLVISMFFVLS